MQVGDINEWADALTEAQAKQALKDVIENSVETELINFPEDALAPYWNSDGEPVVEGQECWEDEES